MTLLFLLLKLKVISSEDAKKIVEQIYECEKFYNIYIGHRRKSRIFLHCVNRRRRRLDSYARTKLKSAKIKIYKCQGYFNLNSIMR